MDRFDEKKHDRIDDDNIVPREEVPAREGDILGLGGASVPKAPGDPSASSDPESTARQRARMLEDEASPTRRDQGPEDTFGASVDLGAAGDGNTFTRKS